VTLVVLGACSASKAASSPPKPTTTIAPVTTTTLAPVIAPLTGVVDPTRDAASRAALAVKIENAPQARPQAGLDLADVVYEEVVEGGITRFIAVFQSGFPAGASDTVGPVRSVRPMDPTVVTPLHPLFAYAGGTKPFVSLLHKAPVQDVGFDAETDAYWRQSGREAPHNLFAHPSALWKAAKSAFRVPPAPLFTFVPTGATFAGTPATSVTIGFSPVSSAAYTWDATSSVWKRAQNGTPHLTASGTQIATANVVVLFVREQLLRNTDAAGNRVPEAVTTGSGDGWVLSQGQAVKIRWSRASASGPATFTDQNGVPVSLTPGKTWVHFVPTGSAVTVH
jgi:hypothetical protein